MSRRGGDAASWSFNLKILPTCLLLLSGISCASTVGRRWPDDYRAGTWRGGFVEYERADASSARRAAEQKMTRAIRKACGDGREPVLYSLMPNLRWQQKTSFLFGSYWQQSWFQRHRYVCPDDDAMPAVYKLVVGLRLRCQRIEDPYRPGRARCRALAALPSTAIGAGHRWMRCDDREGPLVYFFEPEGLALCEEVAAEANDQRVDLQSLDSWLLQRLRRGDEAVGSP